MPELRPSLEHRTIKSTQVIYQLKNLERARQLIQKLSSLN